MIEGGAVVLDEDVSAVDHFDRASGDGKYSDVAEHEVANVAAIFQSKRRAGTEIVGCQCWP